MPRVGKYAVTELRMPNVHGWEWRTESGATYQVMWLHGQTGINLSVRPPALPDGRQAPWSPARRIDGEQGQVPDGTLKTARSKVFAFILAGQDDEPR